MHAQEQLESATRERDGQVTGGLGETISRGHTLPRDELRRPQDEVVKAKAQLRRMGSDDADLPLRGPTTTADLHLHVEGLGTEALRVALRDRDKRLLAQVRSLPASGLAFTRYSVISGESKCGAGRASR